MPTRPSCRRPVHGAGAPHRPQQIPHQLSIATSRAGSKPFPARFNFDSRPPALSILSSTSYCALTASCRPSPLFETSAHLRLAMSAPLAHLWKRSHRNPLDLFSGRRATLNPAQEGSFLSAAGAVGASACRRNIRVLGMSVPPWSFLCGRLEYEALSRFGRCGCCAPGRVW